jgi:hypothetical protein
MLPFFHNLTPNMVNLLDVIFNRLGQKSIKKLVNVPHVTYDIIRAV